jgi:NAD(P)H-dependent FMN reductase
MPDLPRIGLIVGSLRKASFTRKIALADWVAANKRPAAKPS